MDEQQTQQVSQPETPKKSGFKSWWIWLLIIVLVIILLASLGGKKEEAAPMVDEPYTEPQEIDMDEPWIFEVEPEIEFEVEPEFEPEPEEEPEL